MRGARWRREGINLSLGITVAAVELINGVVPLLKATQCLVQCEDLGLAGSTVATSKVCSHSMSGRKIDNLRSET